MLTELRSFTRALAVAAALVPAVCHAQDTYPARPVRFIIPFPAGSPIDFLARLAAQKLTESWGAPVIVEVRDGAGGTIGVNHVVKAAPDGYTLLFTPDLPIVIGPAMSKTGYDPRKDLAPIGAVAQSNLVLVVHPSTGVSTIKELVVVAKAKPGALTFASSGAGSASRMTMELLKQAAGIDLVHVPYKMATDLLSDLVTGRVEATFSPTAFVGTLVKDGKLQALAVGAEEPQTDPFPAPTALYGLSSTISPLA